MAFYCFILFLHVHIAKFRCQVLDAKFGALTMANGHSLGPVDEVPAMNLNELSQLEWSKYVKAMFIAALIHST